MIEAVHFRNFRALRDTHIRLAPFNVLVGPNGSGKTSLIDCLQTLQSLSRQPLGSRTKELDRDLDTAPEIRFEFTPPFDHLEARIGCQNERTCDLLIVEAVAPGEGIEHWPSLRQRLGRIRTFALDHAALSERHPVREGAELNQNGSNLASVLLRIRRESPAEFAALETAFCSLFPEYGSLHVELDSDGMAAFSVGLRESRTRLAPSELSQGTLYGLALVVLAHDPAAPSLLMIEEIDRGLHPRLFRRLVDSLYHLSHPESRGLARPPSQVIVTTHSPLVLDQFRDHPEEVVVASKRGETATFERLSDRKDWLGLIEEGGTLGDLWYAGIFGGVPEEPTPLP